MSNGVQNQGEIAMQTDKYTKVVLTLIAVGIFSLGCGGGASLEEVNELRQEIANLRKQVESLEDTVRTKHLEIVNVDGQTMIRVGVNSFGGSLIVFDKSGNKGAVYAGVSPHETGGIIAVHNKTGLGVVELRVDDYGNGEVGAFNRKGKGRVMDSK